MKRFISMEELEKVTAGIKKWVPPIPGGQEDDKNPEGQLGFEWLKPHG